MSCFGAKRCIAEHRRHREEVTGRTVEKLEIRAFSLPIWGVEMSPYLGGRIRLRRGGD